MGAQISKTAGKEEAAVEKPAEGAAVAAKTNGQVKKKKKHFYHPSLKFSSGVLSRFSNVLRQWRAPCSLKHPHAHRHSGKVATCIHFHRREQFLQF